MKRTITTLTVLCFLGLGITGIVGAEENDAPGKRGRGAWRNHEKGEKGNRFEHLSEKLNLTPEQKAKVQPIIEQAKPQIMAIRQEARQKTQAVMDNTMSQIRPMLTAQQQEKLDAMRKARETMRNARKQMRDARQM